jgi:hypothetical protein
MDENDSGRYPQIAFDQEGLWYGADNGRNHLVE